MSYTVKMLIPIGLGLLAGILNMMLLQSSTAPVEFVTVTEDVRYGDILTSDVLAPVELPSSFAHLKETAYRWEDVGTLYERPIQRPLRKGDLVMFRDVETEGWKSNLRPGEEGVDVPLKKFSLDGALSIGQEITFVIRPGTRSTIKVGPFRLIALGNQIVDSEREGQSHLAGVKQVSVAVPEKPSAEAAKQTELLEQYVTSDDWTIATLQYPGPKTP